MRSTWLRFTFTILLAAQTLPAAPQDLLAKIAAAYQVVIDYKVEVDVQITPEADPVTRFHLTIVGSRPRQWYSHKVITYPLRYELFLGTDGTITWAYSPQAKKYVQMDANETAPLEAETLRQHQFSYFTRFERIDRLDVTVNETGRKNCGRERKCIIIQITPRGNENWTETLLVDAERHLVLESLVRNADIDGPFKTKTKWRYIQLGGDPDPRLFQFSPPPHTTRVNAITIR